VGGDGASEITFLASASALAAVGLGQVGGLEAVPMPAEMAAAIAEERCAQG
jgi:hypothetical protein